MGTALHMGSWVALDDVEVRYVVPESDGPVEFTFGSDHDFSLSLSERALGRCLEAFALAQAALHAQLTAGETVAEAD